MAKTFFRVSYQMLMTFIGAYNPCNYFGYIEFLGESVLFSNGFQQMIVKYKDIQFIDQVSKYSVEVFFCKGTANKVKQFNLNLGSFGNALFVSSIRIKEVIQLFDAKKVKTMKFHQSIWLVEWIDLETVVSLVPRNPMDFYDALKTTIW